MKVFFEAYEYPIETLRQYLSPYFYHASKTQGKGVIGHVGYFFNVNQEDPSRSDSVFILPKVFINASNCPFELEGMTPEDVIELDTEVDGAMYHQTWTGELCYNDQLRNQALMRQGWDVMRFWVQQVRDQLPWCVEQVKNWMEQNN